MNLIPVINPQGETVQIDQDHFQNGNPPPGYKLAQDNTSNVAELANAPAPAGFTKVIKKETGEPILLKNDQLGLATADQYAPFTPEAQERSNRVQNTLKSLEDSPWYEKNSPDLAKEHANDDILTPDGKYKLQTADGKPLDLAPAQMLEALKNPNITFRDPKAQDLYEAQLLHKSTSSSRLESGALSAATSVPIFKSTDTDKLLDPKTANDDRLGAIADHVLGSTKFSSDRVLGNVLGNVGGLVATGGLGVFGEVGAAAKAGGAIENFLAGEAPDAARRIGSWALGKAAEGAVMAAPQVAADLINKDPKLAAESLLTSAGLNVGLGIVGKGVSSLLEKALGSAETPYVSSAIKELTGASEEDVAKMGNPDQLKGFADSLAERGLDKNASKAEEVISKMATGDDLTSAVSKIDKFVETSPVDSMNGKLSGIGQKAQLLEKDNIKIPEMLNQYSDKLTSLADRDGNISLPKLLKFAQDTAEEIKPDVKDDLVNEVRKQVHDEAMQEVIQLGDQALSSGKVDIKSADEWLQAKFNTQVAKQLTEGSIEKAGEEPAKKGVINKIVTTLFKHKIAATAAVMGHTALGPIGGMAGHAVGHMIGHWTEAMSKKLPTAAGSFLKKNAGNSSLSSYLTIASIHNNINKLDDIGNILKTGAVKQGSSTPDIVKDILGEHSNGLSKPQQFNKLANQINMLQGNPQLLQEHIQQTVEPFAQTHPELAKQMASDLNTKIQFIHDIMPKDPHPPQPFQKKEEFKPSKADMDEFADQLKIAENPYALLEGLHNGRVTAKQVAVAQQLNPAILTSIQNKLMDESTKHDLSYQQRLATSVIMGKSMDDSLNNTKALQSVYGPSQQSSAPVPKRHKGGSKLDTAKMPAAQPTLAQKIGS